MQIQNFRKRTRIARPEPIATTRYHCTSPLWNKLQKPRGRSVQRLKARRDRLTRIGPRDQGRDPMHSRPEPVGHPLPPELLVHEPLGLVGKPSHAAQHLLGHGIDAVTVRDQLPDSVGGFALESRGGPVTRGDPQDQHGPEDARDREKRRLVPPRGGPVVKDDGEDRGQDPVHIPRQHAS